VKKYKAPKTRIKVAEYLGKHRYYPQHRWTLGPFLWEWMPIIEGDDREQYVGSREVAQTVILSFLEDHKSEFYKIPGRSHKEKVLYFIKYPFW